jgi:hypothetical protein
VGDRQGTALHHPADQGPGRGLLVRQKTDRKKPSWEVRWKTAHKRHAAVRRTKALAETFWSSLKQAAKNGEEFDIETGLPGSMASRNPSRSRRSRGPSSCSLRSS